jgi:hypothetical protein
MFVCWFVVGGQVLHRLDAPHLPVGQFANRPDTISHRLKHLELA